MPPRPSPSRNAEKVMSSRQEHASADFRHRHCCRCRQVLELPSFAVSSSGVLAITLFINASSAGSYVTPTKVIERGARSILDLSGISAPPHHR